MPDWHARIVRALDRPDIRLTIAVDPDGLLFEERTHVALMARGLDILRWDDDPLAARYRYEVGYRAVWDDGQERRLIVMTRDNEHQPTGLPFDIVERGRLVSFSLADLFPSLAVGVVRSLDLADLDVLDRAVARGDAERLGDNGTRDFILRHIFRIAPEIVQTPADVLALLLELHRSGRELPTPLAERLTAVLRRERRFAGWPLESLVSDRDAFYTFLQARWPRFLDRLAVNEVRESKGSYRTDPSEPNVEANSAPDDLPFEDPRVQSYVDTLFLAGSLEPIEHPAADRIATSWARVGLRVDPDAMRNRQFNGLLDQLCDEVPGNAARARDWLAFAPRWGELQSLAVDGLRPSLQGDKLTELRRNVDDAFSRWVLERYASLYDQPPVPPAMLHHVVRWLARRLDAEPQARVALLVLDGLSFVQWRVLLDVLSEQRPGLQLREGAVFAWVPTITTVSRQALFAGLPPFLFPESLDTTSREPSRWSRAWNDAGLAPFEVGYRRGLNDHASLAVIDELLAGRLPRALGLVVGTIDDIVHGTPTGMAGVLVQVRQWAETGYLADLLGRLLDTGFGIVLTSDHGNVEAVGIGRPAEGAIANLRGERARIYPDSELRRRVAGRFPGSMEWPSVGLPDGYHPLLAPVRGAFVEAGTTIVGHGGIALEELIVPLIEISRESP